MNENLKNWQQRVSPDKQVYEAALAIQCKSSQVSKSESQDQLQNSGGRGQKCPFQKNSKPRADRGAENQFVEKSKTLCERGDKQLQISGGREFEVQNPSENSKPCTEQGQNIKYHRYGKFRMSQVTHFYVDHVYLLILE